MRTGTLCRCASIWGLIFVIAACAPTPTALPVTPAPPTALPSSTAPAPATASPLSPSTPAATATAAAPPTSSGPHTLTVCLVGEPQSLYRYARSTPNRAHILAALYDGPIDTANFGFQPVLFDHLPSLANGDAVLRATTVLSGETVVDALGRVQPLRPGLTVRQQDGTPLTYDGGSAGLHLPQLVVTFHLRPGLLWSDGAPLTAADSVFAFDIARSPDSFDPMRTTANRTQSYQAADATTVVWTGLPGDLDPLYAANIWPPLPRHQLGTLNAAQIAASDQATRAPLGWGPFTLTAWQPGQSLVVQRNPKYWRAAEGLPHLDTVTYRFLSASSDLVSGLRDGTCDLDPSGPAMDHAWGPLQAYAYPGPLSLYNVPGNALVHLDFNLAPSPAYTGTAAGFFQDLRVRQAFFACLDRQKTEAVSLDPHLSPAWAFFAAAQLPFDPAHGRDLLAQAGWPNPAPPITLAGDEAYRQLMQDIRAQLLANCGIALTLQTLTAGDLLGDWPDGLVFGRRFDLALFAWRLDPLVPCERFTTAEIAGDLNPGGANDTGYSYPAFDAACRQAVFPLDGGPDPQHSLDAQRLLAAALPILPLGLELRHGAFGPGVNGYVLDPSSPSELWNIESINHFPK